MPGLAVSVKDAVFGAKGDGVTDDTAAMQAAHNTGRVVYYPAGTYKFTTISLPNGGGIIGDSPHIVTGANITAATVLYSVDTSPGNLIDCTTSGSYTPLIFRDFGLTLPSNTTKTQGWAIYIPPGLTSHRTDWVTIDNIVARYAPNGLYLNGTPYFKVSKFAPQFMPGAAVHVENTTSPDNGDSSISDINVLNCGTGVRQYSSGGLRISGSKFNGCTEAIRVDVRGSTTDLMVTGNSIENSSYGLRFTNTANASTNPVTFGNIAISGNQFAVNTRDIIFEAISNYSSPGSFWDLVSIAGNVFRHQAGTQYSVELNTARFFCMSGNSFLGGGTAATNPSGVHIAGTCLRGMISDFISYFYADLTVDPGALAIVTAGSAIQ